MYQIILVRKIPLRILDQELYRIRSRKDINMQQSWEWVNERVKVVKVAKVAKIVKVKECESVT